MRTDVAVFGGGATGLWLLDELVHRGFEAALFEAHALGTGQTIGCQGIIHGGLKYTLRGLLTSSARQVRDMPVIWRHCLSGQQRPDLSATRIRANSCYLWQTESLRSRLGMMGARYGLRVTPTFVSPDQRPTTLAHCAGQVAQLGEQVLDPSSLLSAMARRHSDRILRFQMPDGLAFLQQDHDERRTVRLQNPKTGEWAGWSPRWILFAAGTGNAELRRAAGLPDGVMQRRPLHMVLLRGALPMLNGHCVDGAKTRVTITSDVDDNGQTVWQVGGQLAEDGVELSCEQLIARAWAELQQSLPGINVDGVEWTTYSVDRAERQTANGQRPDTYQVVRDRDCWTVWPTKLVLVPRLAQDVVSELFEHTYCETGTCPATLPQANTAPSWRDAFRNWPTATVAPLPWQGAESWYAIHHGQVVPSVSRKAA